MKKLIMTLIPALLLSSTLFAAEPKVKPLESKVNRKVSSEWCLTKKWTAKVETLEDMRRAFDQESRETLIQMFWGEVLSNRPRPILVGLAQYLAYTEQKSAVTGYYQTIAMASGSQLPLGEELEKWPKVSKLTKLNSKVKELCQLYLAAGGDDF